MKKTAKISAIALAVVMTVCAMAFVLTACNDDPVDEFAIFRINNNVNYKQDVDVSPNVSDVFNGHGMMLVTGFDESGMRVIEADANDRSVIENSFDPAKPTLIIIHGVQLGEGRQKDFLSYWLAENDDRGQDMALYFFDGEMNYEKKSWNVMYFHWEKFADAENDENTAIGDIMGMPSTNFMQVEERIWTRGLDGQGSRYVFEDDPATPENEDGTLSEPVMAYSVAEWFAAEYIRTFDLIAEVYPEYAISHDEIRVAAHSMGGALCVSGVGLLNLLSEAGKFDKRLLPGRLALLDSFVGTPGSFKNAKYAWNGNSFIANSYRASYATMLRYIKSYSNPAMEFYSNTSEMVPFMGSTENEDSYFKEISSLMCYTIIYPKYINVDHATIFASGHNAIREWYFTSYMYEPIGYYAAESFDDQALSLIEGARTIGILPSASVPSNTIKNLAGLKTTQKVPVGYMEVANTEHIFVQY
ncbi:MAG: hypothetical protein GX891_03040 [Clostridiales bacterium]|nr:hypothetical protein [Clostridiales bacterium]